MRGGHIKVPLQDGDVVGAAVACAHGVIISRNGFPGLMSLLGFFDIHDLNASTNGCHVSIIADNSHLGGNPGEVLGQSLLAAQHWGGGIALYVIEPYIAEITAVGAIPIYPFRQGQDARLLVNGGAPETPGSMGSRRVRRI